VLNNHFEDITFSAVELSSDIPWGQGPFCEDILVQDNTIQSCNFASKGPFMSALGAIAIHSRTGTMTPTQGTLHRDIRILGNRITGCWLAGIHAQNVSQVVILDNVLSNNNLAQRGREGELVNVAIDGAILLNRVADYTVQDNQVQQLNHASQAVAIDPVIK
jgi:parallel beta-helix repeat protein